MLAARYRSSTAVPCRVPPGPPEQIPRRRPAATERDARPRSRRGAARRPAQPHPSAPQASKPRSPPPAGKAGPARFQLLLVITPPRLPQIHGLPRTRPGAGRRSGAGLRKRVLHCGTAPRDVCRCPPRQGSGAEEGSAQKGPPRMQSTTPATGLSQLFCCFSCFNAPRIPLAHARDLRLQGFHREAASHPCATSGQSRTRAKCAFLKGSLASSQGAPSSWKRCRTARCHLPPLLSSSRRETIRALASLLADTSPAVVGRPQARLSATRLECYILLSTGPCLMIRATIALHRTLASRGLRASALKLFTICLARISG